MADCIIISSGATAFLVEDRCHSSFLRGSTSKEVGKRVDGDVSDVDGMMAPIFPLKLLSSCRASYVL